MLRALRQGGLSLRGSHAVCGVGLGLHGGWLPGGVGLLRLLGTCMRCGNPGGCVRTLPPVARCFSWPRTPTPTPRRGVAMARYERPSTSKLRLLVPVLWPSQVPRGERSLPSRRPLTAPGTRLLGRGRNSQLSPRHRDSPLAVLSAWPPRSSLGSLSGPVAGPLPAGPSSLSPAATAASFLALLSPAGEGTGQSYHVRAGVRWPRTGWPFQVLPGDAAT